MNLNQQLKQFIKLYINKKTEKAIVPVLNNGKVMDNYWIEKSSEENTYINGIEIDTKIYKNYSRAYMKKFCSHEYIIDRETYDIKSCYWNDGDYTTGGLTFEEAEYDLEVALAYWLKNKKKIESKKINTKKKKALKMKIYKPMTDEKYFKIYIN